MSRVVPSFALQSTQFSAEKAVLEDKLREQANELRALRQENAELKDLVAKQATQIDELQGVVKHLLRSLKKAAPALVEGQGLLFADAPSATADGPDDETSASNVDGAAEAAIDSAAEAPKKPRDRGRRRRDESNLRVEIRRSELPEDERRCPVTGIELVEVDVKVTFELDYRQAELVRIEHHQVVYGPPPEVAEERQIERLLAPAHSPAIEGVTATGALLAWLLCQKYVLHLPLYRQADAFARLGVQLSRKTLCDWVLKAAFSLEPVAAFIGAAVRAGPVLHLDDTRIRVKRPGPNSDRLKVRQSYLWAMANPALTAVYFDYTNGRSTADVAGILRPCADGGVVEILVGDGYAGNRSGAREAGLLVTFAGCWAHVLRKFRDAESESPRAMALFMADIDRLYDIEDIATDQGLDPTARLALRRAESFEIVRNMLRLTTGWKAKYALGGKVAKAMTYLRGQRRALLQFLRDGRIPLDNNVCERAIRTPAMGRSNWLFAGSVEGARAAATIYTLFESAKQAGVEPLAYLEAVIERLGTCPASEIESLMPWKMLGELPAYRPQD